MRLVIVRHGETDWTLPGRHASTTDVDLTADGRRQAASLRAVLERLLHGARPAVFTSRRYRAVETAALALPTHRVVVEPAVAEYDFGDYEGLTTEEVSRRAPGWDLWRDGCPGGESTADVVRWADGFLHAYAERARPVVVVTRGHFSRILAARALGLWPEDGRSPAGTTASVSLVEDHDGERCVRSWNADATLLADAADRVPSPGVSSQPVRARRSNPARCRCSPMTHAHRSSSTR